MIDITAINSEGTNRANVSSGAIDHSYSQFPVQNTSEDNTPTLSFGDFLDMINPLQHIPVVSSLYRAATGDTINPVSRIAGDALYGGILGLASAGISALGAIGDEVFAAANDGKSASSTIMAALFDHNTTEQTTQLASADPIQASDAPSTVGEVAPAAIKVGVLQTPAKQSPILDIPELTSPSVQLAANTTSTATTDKAMPTSSMPSAHIGPGLAIDRSKAAYGGVLDSGMIQNAQQNQALALALAGGRNTMQSQHDIRNNRFATSNNAVSSVTGTPANTPATVVNSIPSLQAVAAQSQVTALSSAANAPSMQSMIQNLHMMNGLSKYQTRAQSVPVMGASMDLTN